MYRRFALPILLALALILTAGCASEEGEPNPDLPSMTVYKSPTCQCCSKWIDHLRENGFTVAVRDTANVRPVKDSLGVPGLLSSCHTATVEGYVVEGHVPADQVKKMLRERPETMGLAVPGMPIGSPGMEKEGRDPQPYNVIAFDEQSSYIYAQPQK